MHLAYRWSSYHGNVGHVSNKALTPHIEYLALADADERRHAAYRQMLDGTDDPDFLKAVREATNGGLGLLSDLSRARVEAVRGRRLEHKRPGPAPAEPAMDPYSGSFDF
jgi:hypothetical protein